MPFLSARTMRIALVVIVALVHLTTATSARPNVTCTTPDACCDVCGIDSQRCVRGPCSSNILAQQFFFISMPTHIASLWDVVFIAYGTVPSLVPVVLALDLLVLQRTWSRVLAFCLIPLIAMINQGIFVKAFGHCADCNRPCGSCLGTKGFPSGHSANAVGFFVWLMLETFVGAGAQRHWSRQQQLRVVLVSLCVFAPVPFSRVYLGDHTHLQIAVGSLNGAVLALVYFIVARSFIGPKLDAATHWLAHARVPLKVTNDYYHATLAAADDDDDDIEMAALKPLRHPTYDSGH